MIPGVTQFSQNTHSFRPARRELSTFLSHGVVSLNQYFSQRVILTLAHYPYNEAKGLYVAAESA